MRTCAISSGVFAVSATTTLSIGFIRWVRPVFEAVRSEGEGRVLGVAALMVEGRKGRKVSR